MINYRWSRFAAADNAGAESIEENWVRFANLQLI
jgi:hypothetical protein